MVFQRIRNILLDESSRRELYHFSFYVVHLTPYYTSVRILLN